MKPKALAALGLALAATVAGMALLQQRDTEATGCIQLLDARRDSSKPLEQALPVIRQLERKYGARVTVRTAALPMLRDYDAMFEEFDRTREASEPLPIFFALDRPYGAAKKVLRSAIDHRATLHGDDRKRLLERLMVVRGTEGLGGRDECGQLGDDLVYALWNFRGIGLLVHDGTLRELKKCIDALAPAA
jgi:hypothetical protein